MVHSRYGPFQLWSVLEMVVLGLVVLGMACSRYGLFQVWPFLGMDHSGNGRFQEWLRQESSFQDWSFQVWSNLGMDYSGNGRFMEWPRQEWSFQDWSFQDWYKYRTTDMVSHNNTCSSTNRWTGWVGGILVIVTNHIQGWLG